MKQRLIALVAAWIIFSGTAIAERTQFTETKCQPNLPKEEFYVIRLESPGGTIKRLTFNNAAKTGLLVFKSTSIKYLKWTSELADLEFLKYESFGRGHGILSAKHKKRPSEIKFGTISKVCWDGLRVHVHHLVPILE